jgi:hypothetical protein
MNAFGDKSTIPYTPPTISSDFFRFLLPFFLKRDFLKRNFLSLFLFENKERKKREKREKENENQKQTNKNLIYVCEMNVKSGIYIV